ncbi:endonuclease [Gracilibacillus oryzae]|uniref:Endonuclease n=1 Tax=Gracilibacillus oryzae TaxID=1672701 RepID=A0A7C8GQ16_9BACI|nr:Z1 domain-containing protein [Gracilibacillus oryzae]KAB8125580.1 endonuclease [Gracilibacillus oryzae]
MNELNLPIYDPARTTIKNMRNKGFEWEVIIDRYEILKELVLDDKIDNEIWGKLVKEQKEVYENQQFIKRGETDAALVSNNEDNGCYVPLDSQSSWQLYRKKLKEKGLRKESIDQLEENTLKLLRKLSRNTMDTGPIKGLVIGKVQSGKTASMAGLMAMAADWGWNTFIILSGMIENLREQTQERLISDLDDGNNYWHSLHKLSKRTDLGQRTQNLNFNERAPHRYLNVCLKNKTRLENLLGWFKEDPNKLKQMRILVIDDEADQGSINTNKLDEAERTRINKLIIELVNINANGVKPKAQNYISYTATPYSNFLNESADDSLYPKDFIGVLPTAEEYFGSKQIFGEEGADDEHRLDVVRLISEEDKERIKDLHTKPNNRMPRSLVQSICWFLNASSIMRLYNYKKPVSMLVHTSQIQLHHINLANVITDWIKDTESNVILQLCEELYKKEKGRFSVKEFREGFPEYPTPNEELNNYPEFSDMKQHILELIKSISHIMMDEEGELNYHKGIHLCVDNSSNTGVNDENMHVRLAYPSSSKLKELGTAPAFIIIGGSTLSRGLTIEGLVSTYFLRATTAGDSLMQMGRWFGFRKGYELYPRIWMTDNTFDQFQFLTSLEEELREELKEYELGNKNPSEYGPRVKNSPKVSFLRVTAKNKMQNAIQIDMDFSGASIQTIHFENNPKELRDNIEVTEDFLNNKCGKPIKSKISNSLVFKDIDFETIKEQFLLKIHFNERSRVFNDIKTFCDWFEQVKDKEIFKNWNVIVSSAGQIRDEGRITSEKEWKVGSYTLGMVNRSAKASSKKYGKDMINIGVLRGPRDLYADIDKTNAGNEFSNAKQSEVTRIRKEYGVEDVPQLIIYRIYRKSEARNKSKEVDAPNKRIDLDFSNDMIGYAKALTVKIDKVDTEDIEE